MEYQQVDVSISFLGNDARNAQLDFYDVSHALVGFQRSLALTTHLFLNGEVIIQAPCLEGASIVAVPPTQGSWKLTAIVLMGGFFLTASQSPRDTSLGHLHTSLYDYVVSNTLGFPVDFDKTLGQQWEEQQRKESDLPKITESKVDSLIEKCEKAIQEMHRPIVYTETARNAVITTNVSGKERVLNNKLTSSTYEFIKFTKRVDAPVELVGSISGYYINTYKGRVYLPGLNRSIPFDLDEGARGDVSIDIMMDSLSISAKDKWNRSADIKFKAFKYISKTGILKRLLIFDVIGFENRG